MREYAPQFPSPVGPREDRTLIDVLLESAAAHPDQPALDDGTRVLAKEVAKRIEKELEYPGQIRVNVIRETRSTEYAK